MSTPYTKRRAAQYRGPSTSDDYNLRIEENYRDLMVLLNKSRIADVELDELYRRMVKENYSLSRMIALLEERISTLEAGENRFVFYSDSQIVDDNFNGTPQEIIQDERNTYDTRHGVLTLPHITSSSASKLFYTDVTGREVVPPSIEMRVVGTPGTAEEGAYLDTSEPEYALYRKPGLIWERNVVVDSPHIDGAELTLYVKIPTDMSTTPNSNSLVIHPFPSFGATVKEVSYSLRPDPLLRDDDGYVQFNSSQNYQGESEAVGWVVPGGWEGGSAGDDALTNTGPRVFHFSPKPITALRIKLHQPNYYEEAGKYIYTYGLSHLDLRFNKFGTEGKTMIRIDAPDGGTISSILDIQPQIWNVHPAELSNVFEYRVIWETFPDSGIYTETPQPNSEKVWIEVTLKNTKGWSPSLSGLIVDYE